MKLTRFKQKTKRLIAGIGVTAFAAAIMVPTSYAATAPKRTLLTTSISVDNRLVSTPQGFVMKGTMYQPIFYIMNALKTNLGIQSTWDGSVWNIKTNPGFTPHLATKPNLAHGNVRIQINGQTLYATNGAAYVDPANIHHEKTMYVPIYDVMQALQTLGITSTWDGSHWGLFENINPSLLAAYKAKNPNMHIQTMAEMKLSNDTADSLIVEAQSTDNAPVSVGIVSPDGSVFDTLTDAYEPAPVESLQTSDGVIAAAYLATGAHRGELRLFAEKNGKPSMIGQFASDNGVVAWTENGVPQVLQSDRTYSWNISDNNGNKDDVAVNNVYTWAAGKFSQSQQYDSAVFQYHTSLPIPPIGQLIPVLHTMLMNAQHLNTMAGEIKNGMFRTVQFTPQFKSDFAAAVPNLHWLTQVPLTQSINLKEQTAANGSMTYTYAYGNHQLQFTETKQADGSYALASFTHF